jgi:rhodanese-related sulfurtransferase
VQIHPGELLASLGDDKLNMVMLDVRSEADYNLFHIHGAQRVPLTNLSAMIPGLLVQSQNISNTVIVTMSNDEMAATEAWKVLVANAVPNVYILEGGVNNWISIFGKDDPSIHLAAGLPGDDTLHYRFELALGDRYACADPVPYEWRIDFTPKIKLQRQRGPSGGGCG